MKVKTEVEAYTNIPNFTSIDEPLIVSNVWNRSNLVELEFEGKKVIVSYKKLLKAMNNATDNEF